MGRSATRAVARTATVDVAYAVPGAPCRSTRRTSRPAGCRTRENVRGGQPITATITVRDDGRGTENVFVDPRLNHQSETDSVLPITPATGLTMPNAQSDFVVPTQTDALLGVA